MNQADRHKSISDKSAAFGKRLLMFIVFLSVVGCYDHSKRDKDGDSSDGGERAFNDAGAGSRVENQTSVAADEAGGTVELDEVNLSIPEGALDEEIKIGIRVVEPPVPFPDEFEQASDVYELTPRGLEFEEPVKIEVDFREESDRSYVLLWLDDEEDESWEVVDSARIRNNFAEFEVKKVGFFVVAYLVETDGYEPYAGDGIRGGGGIGGSGGVVVDSDEPCRGVRMIPLPVEVEVPIEVPLELLAPIQVAMYLMIDKSTSMNDVSGSATKWAIAVDAINDFVNDPNSQFFDVALQYFPLDTSSCDGTGYDTPAVPMGALPENADNILDSLANTQLGNSTPIEPALRGMTAFCTRFQAEHPDEPCVGVLISSDEPTQCAVEMNALTSISQNAYDDANVRTFTIGMAGADFNLLDQIAKRGGTDCTPDNASDGYACDLTSGMTLVEAFENIHKLISDIEVRTDIHIEIETKILECEWGIPDIPEGEVFESDKINVIFSESGKPEETILKIPAGRSCGSSSFLGGWYYDNEASPTTIIACPQTCDYITSIKTGGSVEFDFGCATMVLR